MASVSRSQKKTGGSLGTDLSKIALPFGLMFAKHSLQKYLANSKAASAASASPKKMSPQRKAAVGGSRASRGVSRGSSRGAHRGGNDSSVPELDLQHGGNCGAQRGAQRGGNDSSASELNLQHGAGHRGASRGASRGAQRGGNDSSASVSVSVPELNLQQGGNCGAKRGGNAELSMEQQNGGMKSLVKKSLVKKSKTHRGGNNVVLPASADLGKAVGGKAHK
jgi:hypothetical protein